MGFGVPERIWRECAARIGVRRWDVKTGRAQYDDAMLSVGDQLAEVEPVNLSFCDRVSPNRP